MRKPRLVPITLAMLIGAMIFPGDARAQFAIFEKLFEKLTDVSFSTGINSADLVEGGTLGFSQFGVELLYNTGYAGATSTVTRTLTEVKISHTENKVDSVFTYTAKKVDDPDSAEWRFELGLGYGQISGLSVQTEQYTTRGAVREFPSASMYAAHATGLYGGLRSGLIQTVNLQADDELGNTKRGSGSAFQAGVVVGYAPSLAKWIPGIDAQKVFPFVELGWIHREFASIDWTGDVVPPELPKELDVGGWQVNFGVQMGVK